jgi:hypothetical protein
VNVRGDEGFDIAGPDARNVGYGRKELREPRC